MNDALKQRIIRALDTLNDERGYEALDYVEFLSSKYAERQRPTGLFARLTETVEDTMRAGKLPVQAIAGTLGVMDSAAKIMRGLAAAGQAVVDEAVRAAQGKGGAASTPAPASTPTDAATSTATAASTSTPTPTPHGHADPGTTRSE